jgi:hypothetical protein
MHYIRQKERQWRPCEEILPTPLGGNNTRLSNTSLKKPKLIPKKSYCTTLLLMRVPQCVLNRNIYKGKGKAVPLQAWSGPEGSRKLGYPDYMTTVQDGGKDVSLKHRSPLHPRKCSWYSFLLEAESIPGP